MRNSVEVIVEEFPLCDICKQRDVERPARYDGRTKFRVWAYMCETCFKSYGVGLGTGKGQKLVKRGEQ